MHENGQAEGVTTPQRAPGTEPQQVGEPQPPEPDREAVRHTPISAVWVTVAVATRQPLDEQRKTSVDLPPSRLQDRGHGAFFVGCLGHARAERRSKRC